MDAASELQRLEQSEGRTAAACSRILACGRSSSAGSTPSSSRAPSMPGCASRRSSGSCGGRGRAYEWGNHYRLARPCGSHRR